MTAGDVSRRIDGLRWVEVQTSAVEPSGWRLMVPLVDLDDAAEAPPLVVTVSGYRARAHLLRAAPDDQLGEPDGKLDPDDLAVLCDAVRDLIATTE